MTEDGLVGRSVGYGAGHGWVNVPGMTIIAMAIRSKAHITSDLRPVRVAMLQQLRLIMFVLIIWLYYSLDYNFLL